MTALIFGANGQDGYYLSRLLETKNMKVIGVSRKGTGLIADIADLHRVETLVREYRPTYLFHLAAESTTRHEALFSNHHTISTGTLNILESVKKHSPETKVFISGSGLQFANTGKPISESDTFDARDAYSVSRIQSVYAARYFRRLGVRTYVGYFFNHDSPRRSSQHITKLISEKVRQISNGETVTLTIGDISVVKEWGFAADIVEAVWTLVNQEQIFEATIGTGKGYSIREYLELCFNFIGKDWSAYVQQREGFRAEYTSLVSNPSTIQSLGWRHKTSFDELVKKMLTE